MKEKTDTFSNRLLKAMEFRNMKASELAEKSGIPKSSISEYLKGKYEAKQRGVTLLSNALMVNENWLMGYNVPMEKTSEIPYRAIFDFSTESDRAVLNEAIVYAIQNNLSANDIPNNSEIAWYLNKLDNLNKNLAIIIIQNLSNTFKGKDDFSLENYINSLNYKTREDNITPKARVIARGFDKLPPDKQKLYADLLNSMLDDEE